MGGTESRIIEYIKMWQGVIQEGKFKKIYRGMDIHNLPEELLLHIFSYVHPIELCQNVSEVCMQWNKLSADPLLFRHLQFINGTGSTITLIKLLKMAPFLKGLTLENRSDLKEILEQVWESNPIINTLIIKTYTESFQPDNELIIDTIVNCRQLMHVNLIGCQIKTSSLYKGLMKRGCFLKKIKCFNLRSFHQNATIDFKSVLDANDDDLCHTYNSCGMAFPGITSDDVATLCNSFCNTLTSIKVDFNSWSLRTFDALLKCLRLKSLGIYEAHNFPREGLFAISTLPKLQFLEMTCCDVSEDMWTLMFSHSALRNLKYLNLCRCNVSDVVAATIGRNMKQLQVLGLTGREAQHPMANTWLSNVGLSCIIRGCSKLKVLELMYMDPSVEDSIRLIPKYLVGLKKLCLVQNSYTDWKSVTEIKQVMGNLVVDYF